MNRPENSSSSTVGASLLDRPILTAEQRREDIRRMAKEDARRAVESVRAAFIEALERQQPRTKTSP